MRAQGESGEVPQAVGRIEEWLENRLRRHRLPENVITQQYSDGRWIQIIERRMSDGGTIGIRLDITGLKKGEEERLALEAQLHHSQKLEALGTLAGGIAHDLNNTLVPVARPLQDDRQKPRSGEPRARAGNAGASRRLARHRSGEADRRLQSQAGAAETHHRSRGRGARDRQNDAREHPHARSGSKPRCRWCRRWSAIRASFIRSS